MSVGDLPGAGPSLLAATLESDTEAFVVLVADTPGEAELLYADLETLEVSERSRYLPQRETLPYEEADPHVEISSRRAEAISALLDGKARLVVTTSRGLVERAPVSPEGEFGITLTVGDRITRGDLAERLATMGFERTTGVRELGEYVVRGGIVDVFPFGADEPLRFELWDDRVESLRRFDLITQRSTERLPDAAILPITLSHELFRADGRESEHRSLLELLPDDAWLLFRREACDDVRRRRLWEEIRQARKDLGDDDAAAAEALPPAEAARMIARLRVLDLDPPGGGTTVRLGLDPHPPIERRVGLLVDEIQAARGRGDAVLILCDSAGQLERLQEILADAAGLDLAGGAVGR